MEPSPVTVEMPVQPTPPEAKPVSPAAKTESPAEKPTTIKQDGSARSTLEAIAKGTPVAEAIAPKAESVPLPDKEKVQSILSETNQLLLDLRDMRLLVSSIASQAADTPLGNEMRMDTLRMIGSMSNADMPPEAVVKLDAVQKQIADLKLPEAKPDQSALLPIMDAYNKAHPDKAVPVEVINQIKSGSREASATVAQLLQSNPDIAGPVWKELTGVEGFTGLHDLTPQKVLEISKLPTTKENLAKANDMFGKVAAMTPQEQLSFMEIVGPKLMVGALVIMFLSQMANEGNGGGGGH